jgi:PhnB protein
LAIGSEDRRREEDAMAVDPIPKEYGSVTPYLLVEGADRLIEFMKRTFDAEERGRMPAPDGKKIGHAEIQIGDSIVMLADASTSDAGRPMPAMFTIYVEDVDKTYKRALEAGATSQREPADQFYGDRNAGVKDEFGNLWWIQTHIEDVPPEEMERRVREQGSTG